MFITINNITYMYQMTNCLFHFFTGRGFGCFSIDALWKLILFCKGSTLSLTIFNQSGQDLDPHVGTRLRQELLAVLRKILKEHRQEHLQYYLGQYCNYRVPENYHPLKIKDIQEHRMLKCCQENIRGDVHFLSESDLEAWYKEVLFVVCLSYFK